PQRRTENSHIAIALTMSLDMQRLPEKLQRKLDYPARIGARDLPEAAGAHCRIRRTEMHLVEGVEELTAELSSKALARPKLFHQSDIRIEQGRAVHEVSSRIPVAAQRHLRQ